MGVDRQTVLKTDSEAFCDEMRAMRNWRLLATLASALPLLAQVEIGPSTPVVVSPREPVAIRKAAADLETDLARVFGKRRAGANAKIVVAFTENLPSGVKRPSGVETLLMQASGRALVLTGSDIRGTIYAIYEFSRKHLGVDPLHYWTDHEPARRTRIVLAAGYREQSESPTFKYRGWFINDEDLLTGWRPGTKDKTGISLEVWDKIFEAVLRLRGNMIVPGTFIFPDEPQVRAAGERGLVITQHHIEVLGTNTWRWPDAQPYSYADHPQVLMNAWRNSMRGYGKDQEVIWTVGYRGRHDRAFWLDDKSIPPTDEARAAAIRKAIDAQVALVRAEHKAPYLLMNAWQEAVPFIAKGLLKLPEGVTLVWPDNGHGLIQDRGLIAKGQGVYYHTAMHDFRSNQLTEMVPLERIGRELGRAARAGATDYMLVNVSDVRPVPLTTRAVMELAAAPATWNEEEYLMRWCREEFGENAAAAVAAYYRAFFAAPGRYGKAEDAVLADCAYHNYMRYMLVTRINGKPELSKRFVRIEDWEKFVATMGNAAREAIPRWEAVRALAEKAAPLVAADRRQFFQSHVLTQMEIHRQSNRALAAAADGRIDEVVVRLRLVLEAFEAAEYGKWKGFYADDRFTNVRQSLQLAEACAAKIAGKPLPAGLKIQALVDDPYHWLKSYQSQRWVDTR